MTISRSEDLFVGLVALVLVVLIAARILRGLRLGSLPLYRTYIRRDEAPGKFNALLALHALSLLVVAGISADLLFGFGARQAP